MKRLFLSTRILFRIGMAALVLALIIQFAATILNALDAPHDSAVLGNVGIAWVLDFVWFFVVWIASDMVAYVKVNRLLRILYVECDPDRFLENVLPLALIPGLEPFTRTTLQQFVSLGLESFGDFDKAYHWLQDCHRSEKPAGNAYFNAMVDYSLARLCHRRGEQGAFQEHRTRLATHAAALSKIPGMRETLSIMVRHLDVVDGMDRGEYPQAREFFEGRLPKARSELERVNNHFNLAQVHEAVGDTGARRNCLAYAAEHGKGLWTAKMARYLLEAS